MESKEVTKLNLILNFVFKNDSFFDYISIAYHHHYHVMIFILSLLLCVCVWPLLSVVAFKMEQFGITRNYNSIENAKRITIILTMNYNKNSNKK